jgi:hypothetical protein
MKQKAQESACGRSLASHTHTAEPGDTACSQQVWTDMDVAAHSSC